MTFPQDSGCGDHRVELASGVFGLVDAAVGETAEAAIGVEQDLLGRPVLEGLLRLRDDLLHRLGVVRARIHHAEADARGLLDKIAAEQQTLLLPEHSPETRPTLHFGLACWQKGDDMRTLLRSALQDLRQTVGQ